MMLCLSRPRPSWWAPSKWAAWSAAGLLAAALPVAAVAQEAVIRKNLPERLPNLPKIDEVVKTAVPGIWEVRIGTDLF